MTMTIVSNYVTEIGSFRNLTTTLNFILYNKTIYKCD